MNPLRSLFVSQKAYSGTSALGSLISAYLREGDDATLVHSEDVAYRIAAVMACVRLIAETVGSLPLHAFQRTEGGKARVPVTNSLERLLQKPNPWQTPLEFREQLTAHLLLRGNGYAYIDWQTALLEGRVVDQAVGLYPLPPDQVEVVRRDDNYRAGLQYFLHRASGGKIELPAEEVLHLKGLSSDGVCGRSVLSDARETFAGALSTQRYSTHLFENDATPGVVLQHPTRLTDEVAARIRRSWDSTHAGPRNARRTAVLEEGMTVSKLSVTPDEAQFLETRKYQRSEIAGLFRVPGHLIGDLETSTSWGTGIEQQQIGFLVYTIRPWLIRWEQAIKRSLIIREDTMFVEHLVEGLLRGDVASRYEAYVKAVNNAIFTPNEIRALENQNPSNDPAADRLYRQASVVPIDTPVGEAGRPTA